MRFLFYIFLYGIISIVFFTNLSFQEYLNQSSQIECGLVGLGIGLLSIILAMVTDFIHEKIKGE